MLFVDADMYDELGLEQVVPEPSEQQNLGSRLRMTFEPPPNGRVMSVTFAGRIPTQQLPRFISVQSMKRCESSDSISPTYAKPPALKGSATSTTSNGPY